jgi:hypothetical protein
MLLAERRHDIVLAEVALDQINKAFHIFRDGSEAKKSG